MKLLFSLLVSSILILNQIAYINAYGESVNGYPASNERETVLIINMVRMFPIEFKRDYLLPQINSYKGIDKIFTKYGSVNPIRQDHSLNIVARAHSQDMANNKCFQHDSCNGENIWSRFKRYNACGGGNGENISANSGNGSPLTSMTQFLCDSVNGTCVEDGVSGDGHRKNIMSAGYGSVGSGYFYNPGSTYRNYYTQDFAGSVCDVTNDSPIYSAYYTMLNSNTPRFVAVYSNSTNPFKSVSLVYNSTSYEMDLTYGTKSFGVLTKDNIPFEFCAPFFFESLDSNNNLIRYPEEGFLRLATNSSCSSWSLSEISSSNTLSTGLSITLIISIVLSLLFI